MSTKKHSAAVALLVAAWLLGCTASAQKDAGELSLLFWNLQNAFDDQVDGGEYSQYIPKKGGWNSELFQKRLARYAQVLDSFPQAQVLIFAEVENDNVLRQLQLRLRKNYRHRFALDSLPKSRLGVLSQLDIAETRQIDVNDRSQQRQLRPILMLRLMHRRQTMLLFVNHWKSKLGGAEQSEAARLQASRRLGEELAELLAQQPLADLVLVGDFNESHDEFVRIERRYRTALMPWQEMQLDSQTQIWLSDRGEDAGLKQGQVVLFSPWYSIRGSSAGGSYFFRGTWQSLDQFLLGAGLFDQQGYNFISMEVGQTAAMLDKEGRPRGWNDATTEGYSDHLPILLRLSVIE